jgi:hypothetical protein
MATPVTTARTEREAGAFANTLMLLLAIRKKTKIMAAD